MLVAAYLYIYICAHIVYLYVIINIYIYIHIHILYLYSEGSELFGLIGPLGGSQSADTRSVPCE